MSNVEVPQSRPFSSGFAAGLAVPLLAAFFSALTNGNPVASVIGCVALTIGAVVLRPVSGARLGGVVVGIVTSCTIAFGLLFAALANADF